MFQFIVKQNHFLSKLTCAVCAVYAVYAMSLDTLVIASGTDNAGRRAPKSRYFRRVQHDAMPLETFHLSCNDGDGSSSMPLVAAVQVLRPDAPWLKPSGSESSRVGPKNEREAEQAQRYDRSRQQPAHWPTGALEE